MLIDTFGDILGLAMLGDMIGVALAVLAGRVVAMIGQRVASWFDKE